MGKALLEVRDLWREFPSGEGTVAVLKGIDLTIEAGEMVAIMGASGSGKSTLMNILGCLDRPTRGQYEVAGQSTAALEPDELARLRREHFGFIFQRYHLMGDLTAEGNVEIPAIYAGMPPAQRHERAQALLQRLGLGDRTGHRPGQLSGGQQQRVSIARALMNGGDVILADEPTGALDSVSGAEVMRILRELHADGHTVILVTHDAQVASHAQRVIEISDGRIVADRRQGEAASVTAAPPARDRASGSWLHAHWDRLAEAFTMALRAMAGHRLRTLLTMLGIVIGIASVVSVVALGQGSRERILKDISAMGTNTIDIFPGKNFGDRRAATIHTLIPGDARALSQLSYVDSVSPTVSTSVTSRRGNVEASATVSGVSEAYFRVKGYTLAEGQGFDADSVSRLGQEAVIDPNTRRALFAPSEAAVGQVIFLGSVPVRVIGVTAPLESAMGNTDALNIWVPYTTAMKRMLGQDHLRNITMRISDQVPSAAAEQGIVALLTQRHGVQDFFTRNSDSIRQTVENATQTMTMLVSAIALISLVVGGIGVMNIMLVSVTERTQEIGVRMAVGARQSDILRQFLIEAVLVCLIGGVLGIGIALLIGLLFERLGGNFSMVYSSASIVTAFAVSTLIGVVFGFLPARNAARLDPVDALARQ
ncbi:macrolide ABC transporter permease/ATP-binding protein MacB [Aquabacterium olei]|uniref:Pyoverdine export ATP-binding/permease protein PvdT n=1 Tax=Aquabacterium olei TaxID=1296669 RepID=A0A2U8FSF9_9BURK|nr:MacB family efflux pump subunit [Aquabacterium olei]AWI53995.1 macrolide ABC transporter permease/ATP-binding protein MacB [Aquabacterium olei]